MKKLICILWTLLLLAACDKEEISTYSAVNYVQFTRSYVDSSTVSFFYYPGKSSVEYPLPVKLIGLPLEADQTFKIKAVDGLSTARKDTHYKIPDEMTFRAGQEMDTVYITLLTGPELDTRDVRLVLEIGVEGKLQPGQTAFIRKILHVTNDVSKPAWWTQNITEQYLGVYSRQKFREFILITGIADLTGAPSDVKRAVAIQFRDELERLTNIGTPVIEERTGENMLLSVPVKGN